jgi:ABC-2 type transport system permease protein
MSTIATLYVANVKEFIRDRAALFWTFAFPLIFIVLFGLIYGNSGSVSFNVVLIDQDHTTASQHLIAAFQHVSYFKVKNESETKAASDIKDGNVDGLIVVPAGFGASLGTHTPAALQMTYAGAANSSNASGPDRAASGQQVLAGFNQSITYTPPPRWKCTRSPHRI